MYLNTQETVVYAGQGGADGTCLTQPERVGACITTAIKQAMDSEEAKTRQNHDRRSTNYFLDAATAENTEVFTAAVMELSDDKSATKQARSDLFDPRTRT